MRFFVFIILFIVSSYNLSAQYVFEGYVDKKQWQGDVYLSLVEDYRQLDGIYDDQIISKVSTDSLGYFRIEGNQLENEHRIYKLHVDNCESDRSNINHFQGHCLASRDIVFIAKNNDTIQFPISMDKEIFCDIQSNNPFTSSLFEIDSMKEEMMFAYSEFRSKASRKLNNKKWFKTLQEYGKDLNEPLAELYIYYFLSDRSRQFRDYYLKDVQENSYYDDLLSRLERQYPKTTYYSQYKNELASDRFINTDNSLNTTRNWIYLLIILLTISIVLNVWFVFKSYQKKKKFLANNRSQLTKQENTILDHLLEEKTNKEIAETLFVSVSTVKSHVNNIYKKYRISSRNDLKQLFNK